MILETPRNIYVDRSHLSDLHFHDHPSHKQRESQSSQTHGTFNLDFTPNHQLCKRFPAYKLDCKNEARGTCSSKYSALGG